MITIDSREENREKHAIELQPLIESCGVKTQVGKLKFGDYSFEGNGPRGMALIGVERKRIRDLLSSMRTGRLHGHQIPGMADTYDFPYLIVEGVIRAGGDGILEESHRKVWHPVLLGYKTFMWQELDHFLCTIEAKTPLTVRRTGTPEQSAMQLASLWRWWNCKEWSEHKSNRVFHRPTEPLAVIGELPLARRVAKELYKVGFEKSAVIAGRFRSVKEMVEAPAGEWKKLPGIGDLMAEKIVAELRGEE